MITGASSGLGEAAARMLSSVGATVVLATRHKDRIEAFAAEFVKNGGKALALETDVTDVNPVKIL